MWGSPKKTAPHFIEKDEQASGCHVCFKIIAIILFPYIRFDRREKNRSQKNKGGSHEETSVTKKTLFLNAFAITMITAGFLVLLYPIVGNYLSNRERSQAELAYDQTMEETSEKKKEQYQLAQKYNQYIYEKQQGKNPEPIVYKSVLKNRSGVMGTIDIPAIDIKKMPFYHGTSYQTLDKGLGISNQLRFLSVARIHVQLLQDIVESRIRFSFTDIRNLVEGDLFFINILGERLAYQITSFEEILPSEADKVKINAGKDEVNPADLYTSRNQYLSPAGDGKEFLILMQ